MTVPAYPSKARLAAELDMAESTVDDMVKRGVLPPAERRRDGVWVWNWAEVERRLRALPAVGTIYFAGCGEHYVKIGFTAGYVEHRLKVLQIGAPERLTIVAEFPGTMQDETALHRRFAAYRTVGEWFRREGEVSAFIGRLEADRK